MNGRSALANRITIFCILAAIFSGTAALAAEGDQPYIDSIKKSLSPSDSSGYTDKIQKQLAPDDSEGYTETLKKSGALKLEGTPGSYTEEERQKLEPKAEGGAIEAVREGHSELHMKKSLDIHNAFGIRVGMGLTRNITANSQVGTGQSFNGVYGTNYAPDVSLFGEHQLFHDEVGGSFGVFGMGTIGFFHGTGAFATAIPSAAGPSVTASQTNLRFFEVPATVGGVYRLNLFKYFRPYVMAGPTVIGFSETRNDGGPTHNGLSHGIWGAVGVSILMDWFSQAGDWDRYQDYGVKHVFLTVEYSKLTTISSPVDFSVYGPSAGFTFEF